MPKKNIKKDMEEFAEKDAAKSKSKMTELLEAESNKIKKELDSGTYNYLVSYLQSRSSTYFTRKTFHANRLASDICFADFNNKTMNGTNRGFFVINDKDEEIYRYTNGVWKEDGESLLRQIVAAVLADKCSSHYQNEVVNFVRSIGALRVERDQLNSELKLINLSNGVYNTETKALMQHDMKYYFLNKLDIEYNAKADCPSIKKFLQDILHEEDVLVVQELFGYLLWKAYPIDVFFLCVGGGRNGKTTLLTLMEKFIGVDNKVSIPLNQLAEDQFAIANLYGKLANISGDIGSADIRDTSLIKQITGGDRVSAQHKFGHRFDFFNYAKIIYACNQLPRFTNDDSNALWSRVKFFNFPNVFPDGDPTCDKDIIDKITTSEELSGLFNYAMEGLNRLMKQGTFSYNKSWDVNREQYKRASDPVLAFSEDLLEYAEGEYIPSMMVFRKFTEWCRERKITAGSEFGFFKKLGNAIPGIYKDKMRIGDGERIYVVINARWKDPEMNKRFADTRPETTTPQTTLETTTETPEPNIDDSDQDRLKDEYGGSKDE